MQTVVLAAPGGHRPWPLEPARPHCLHPLGGTSPLDQVIDAIFAGGTTRIVVVGPGRNGLLEEADDEASPGAPVEYVPTGSDVTVVGTDSSRRPVDPRGLRSERRVSARRC